MTRLLNVAKLEGMTFDRFIRQSDIKLLRYPNLGPKSVALARELRGDDEAAMAEMELGFGKGVEVDRAVRAWEVVERELAEIKERLDRLEKVIEKIALGLGVQP